MEIKNMTNRTLPEVKHRISNGASAITFKTTDGRVLKRFVDNEIYQRILLTHNYQFLTYLIELAKMDNSLFVDIDEVFLGSKKRVGAYTYEYQAGTTIADLYPKTDLIKLRNALVEAQDNIKELEDFRLRDIHSKNVIYTGDIKVIDTDFCTFDDSVTVEENMRHFNNAIVRGLFDFKCDASLKVDRRLKGSFESIMHGESGVTEFLDDYMNLLKKEHGTPKYYKHLTKDFIGEKHGLFGRR